MLIGSGPSASRGDPPRDIHFVEQGQRARGALVQVTRGYTSAFNASWVTMLVPLPPTQLEGSAWTRKWHNGDQAIAIANLPSYRKADDLRATADAARFRLRQSCVWILGTNPLIVALPAGEPKRSWRQFAMAMGNANPQSPHASDLARFVMDEELSEPVSRLAVFPSGFDTSKLGLAPAGPGLTLVTLKEPMAIDDALNALSAVRPLPISSTEMFGLKEQFAFETDRANARREDQRRLQEQQ